MTVSHLLPQCADADVAEAVSEPSGDIPIPLICAEAEVSAGIELPTGAQEEIMLSQQLGRAQTMEDVEALASEEHVEEPEEPAAGGGEMGVQQPVVTGSKARAQQQAAAGAGTGAQQLVAAAAEARDWQPVATGAGAGVQQPAAAGAETQRQPEEGRAGARPARKPSSQKQLISLQAVLEGRAQEVQCPSLPVLLEEEVRGTHQPLVPQPG